MKEVPHEEVSTLIRRLKELRKVMDAADYQEYVKNEFGDVLSLSTMQGHAYHKPHGYAGDYEIIDKIYTKWLSPNATLRVWDDYFHNQEATKAVRNRKLYFLELLNSITSETPNTRVLNIGSGPGRDMLEYFQSNNLQNNVNFECVDLDKNAIEYAKSLCRPYISKIKFNHKNIFRYKTTTKFDLVWSAGLFDYFDDDKFIYLLKRLLSFVADNGQVVVGNFSIENPTRDYMEVIGDWHLHHRSKQQLISLAKKAGIPMNNIKVRSEPLGVNLFLHVSKSTT